MVGEVPGSRLDGAESDVDSREVCILDREVVAREEALELSI